MYRNPVGWVPTAAAGNVALSGTPAVFPTKCLPNVVREAVKTCAVFHQVPEALSGCIALGVLAAAVGKGLVLRSGPNRVTHANLFIVLGAQSGSGKSATFAELTSPLIEFESQQLFDWQTDQIRRQAERHVLEAKIRSLARGLFRTRSVQERTRIQNRIEDALDALEANKRNNQPPRIWIEDATPEALADDMNRNRGMIASLSPEAGAVINGLVRKSGTPDRRTETLLCKGYSVEPCRVDRRSRPPILLNQPCLTLLWLLQPEKVRMLYGIEALAEGGFLARLMPGLIELPAQPITEESAGIMGTSFKSWHAFVD